jgi:hypothetical protein
LLFTLVLTSLAGFAVAVPWSVRFIYVSKTQDQLGACDNSPAAPARFRSGVHLQPTATHSGITLYDGTGFAENNMKIGLS